MTKNVILRYTRFKWKVPILDHLKYKNCVISQFFGWFFFYLLFNIFIIWNIIYLFILLFFLYIVLMLEVAQLKVVNPKFLFSTFHFRKDIEVPTDALREDFADDFQGEINHIFNQAKSDL